MSHNTQSFVTDLLLALNAIALGEAPAAEDYDYVARKFATIVRDLESRQKVYLPDLDDIPDDMVEALSEVCLLRLGPGFGRPLATLPEIVAAEDRLKAVAMPARTRRTLATDPVLRRGAAPRGFVPGR